MYKVESKTEQPIVSKEKRKQEKMKEFREYLVQQDVVLIIVKFLLSIKNDKIKNNNLTQAFKEYIGGCTSDTSEYDELLKNVEDEKAQTQRLQTEIEKVKDEIKKAKEEKARKQEEERIRLEQEAQKKDSKKPGKK